MSTGATGRLSTPCPWVGHGVLMALILVAPIADTCAADTPTATPGSTASVVEPAGQMDDRAALAARLREVRELLTMIDGLETHLTGLAQRSLDHADAAPTLDERRRYERLYSETSVRLGELQITRSDIQRQLEQLELGLKTPHADP